MLSACLTMLFVNADGVFVSWTSPTDATLYSMFMVNATDGWATCEGTILHWNGTSWTNVTSPITSDLWSVFRVSDTDCWAVGKLGTIIRWNGTAWVPEFPSTAPLPLLAGFTVLSIILFKKKLVRRINY
jgi:hypothetical protein